MRNSTALTRILILLAAVLGFTGLNCEKNPGKPDNPAGAPTLSQPPNGSATSDTTPAFDWSDVAGAAGYEIQVDDTAAFSQPEIDALPAASTHTDSLALKEDTYYWRVRALSSGGTWGNWSGAWSFSVMTHGPQSPVLSLPPSGTSTTDDTPAFVWKKPANAVSYEVQIDTLAGFGSPSVDAYPSDSIFVPASSLGDALYYWRVRGKNAAGLWSDWSQTFQLTVGTGYRWSSRWGTAGSGNGQFYGPWGVALDLAGNVYVSDTQNHRVQKFTPSGTFIASWGTQGSGNGEFVRPKGIAVDRNGFVYVVDSGNYRVQKFTSDGTFVRSWGAQGGAVLKTGEFYSPAGICVGADSSVYVADGGGDSYLGVRIQKFDSKGNFREANGSYGSGLGQFDDPRGLAVDVNGYVYVVDSGNSRIKKLNFSGSITSIGSFGDNNGELNRPSCIAVDASGNLYVTQGEDPAFSCRIQKLSSSGVFIASLGTHGNGDRQLNTPRGIAVDAVGNIFAVDGGNQRVQRFERH